MKAHDILDMIGDAKGTYVWDAQQVRSGNIKPSGKKLVSKKLWLIAAIIALILLLVGCAIVYVLSLQDMKIGENTITEREHYGPNWEVIEETQITYDVLSVQSFSDFRLQLGCNFRRRRLVPLHMYHSRTRCKSC